MPTRSDITVVNSAYATMASARPQKLSNGWLVSVVFDSVTNGGRYVFEVSKDNGGSYTQLCTLENTSSFPYKTGGSIQSKGTIIYFTAPYNTDTIKYLSFDANTVTNINLHSTTTGLDAGQTALGTTDLIANDAKTELHAAWSSKNATYPNSFNIRYAKGTINADGSVTWGTVTQVSKVNTGGENINNPSIVVKNNIPYIVTDSKGVAGQMVNSYYISVFSTAVVGGVIFGGTSSANTSFTETGWGNQAIYNGTTSYAQSSPSAIFVPQSINGLANGRIWVTWHGADSTDTTANNIRVSYSDDGGVTWSAMAKLTTGNSYTQRFPSITANKSGDVFIVWNGRDVSDIYEDIRQIKYSGGSWGSVQVISNGTTADKLLPSALFDLTLNFTQPLFIYKDSAKVGFYGTWTITTISVTPGAIGTKTSADKSNFLTYTITTDGSMSTITEKVNGAVVGTKTATSGQSQIAGLTQAQWDAVKFGKYADATGGLNTITVEMGTDLWTYTFDKRLATNEDIAQAVKATQDTQTTYLPSVKSKLASAITSKGGTASGSDSWDTLVNGINGLSNLRSLSGTVTSSASNAAFTYVSGATANWPYVTVTGLSFKPTLIYLFNRSGITTYFSIYTENADQYPKTVKAMQVGDSNSASAGGHFKGDVSPSSVTSTGFTIPVVPTSTTFTWIAFG